MSLFRDEAYVANVVDTAKRLATHHRDHSGLGALEKAAAGFGDDATRVFDLVEQTLDFEAVATILDVERGAFAASSTYSSKFQGYSTGAQSAMALARARNFISLVVAIDPHMLRLAKRRIDGDTRSVSFAGTPNSVRVLKGTLTARVWTLSPITDSDDLAAIDRAATPGQPIELQAGDVCRMTSFQTLEYLPSPGPVLMLISQMSDGEAPMSVVCDADTGRIRSTQAIGQAPSRLQMLSTLLRMSGRTDAWDAIRDLLSHELHFVRWHAMRELVALDPGRALPDLLRLMETDPQPSVRRCARRTLDLVNAHLAETRAA
ncbi:hypothetical protein ASE86_04135 [Sphingomonas sp. Leaf33]|nr:hypothetical protein ASE86_04135 [Sphingomonas sp. Leaf33]